MLFLPYISRGYKIRFLGLVSRRSSFVVDSKPIDHHVVKIQIYLVKAQTFFDSLDVYWSAWWLS